MGLSRWCDWHSDWVSDGQATEVGADEPASGPGTIRWACWPCVYTHGLTTSAARPLPEKDRPFTGRRNAPPIPAPAPGGTE